MSLFGMDPYDFVVEEPAKPVQQEKERKCKECGWVGVSKEHAAGPCIPVLEEVPCHRETGSVDLEIGRKVDTPLGVGKVVALPNRTRVVQVRLYCAYKDCRSYLLGHFTSVEMGYFETKEGMCDLRNQEYKCARHSLRKADR